MLMICCNSIMFQKRTGLKTTRARVAALGDTRPDTSDIEREDAAFFDKLAEAHPRMRDRVTQVKSDRALKSREMMIRFRRVALGSTAVALALLLVRSCDDEAAQAPSTPTPPNADCRFSEDIEYTIQPGDGIEDFVYEVEGIDSANHPCFDETEVLIVDAIEGIRDYDQIWPGDTIYIPRSVDTVPANK